MSYPCCICGAVGLYRNGNRNYCKSHKQEAWGDRARTCSQIESHPPEKHDQPTLDSFFRNVTRKAKAQRESGYLNPTRKPKADEVSNG